MPPFNDRNLAIQYMKDEPVANGQDTLSQMRRRNTRMRLVSVDLPEILVKRLQLSQPGLPSLRADVRSSLEPLVCTASLY